MPGVIVSSWVVLVVVVTEAVTFFVVDDGVEVGDVTEDNDTEDNDTEDDDVEDDVEDGVVAGGTLPDPIPVP